MQSFVAYANAHGRADLARAAQEDLRVDAALMQAGRKYLDSRYYGGIPNELMAKTTSLWSIGAALLLQLVLGLAVLIPLSTWRSRQTPEERREVSPLDVASAVLPPLFAVAACAWMIWHRREMDWAGWQTSVEEQTPVPASALLAWAVALAPLPFIAVWCAVGSAWSRRARSREENQEAGRSSDARSARNYAEGRDEVLVKRVGALVLGLGWVMLSGLALAALLIPDDGSSSDTVILVRWLLPVEGLMVLALHLFLRRQAAEHATRRADSPNAAHTARLMAAQRSGSNALERVRRALCWSTALAAVAWVALATASLPLRNEAQARLDLFVQNGEMSLVRRDAGMQP